MYAAATRRMVAWVGAGLSKQAGLPTWSDLQTNLIQRAQQQILLLAAREERVVANRRLQAVLSLENPWLRFSVLRVILGAASWEQAIREELRYDDEKVVPPQCIDRLWDLRFQGVVSLNVDQLLRRSFYAKARGLLNEGVGKRIAGQLHFLNSNSRFLFNLHGTLEDASTWVFTDDEKKELIDGAAYKAFVQTIFIQSSVLFVGITADDEAATAHLEQLANAGLKLTQHFWLTDRRDVATKRWAEKTGIQLILYDRESDGHEASIAYVLGHMKEFQPSEKVAPPVNPRGVEENASRAPELLMMLDPEAARQILSSYATKILNSDPDDHLGGYRDFKDRYALAINHAGFVSAQPPHNILFGHMLKREVGGGAFGRVYEASTPSGEDVAIKMLRKEVQDDAAMLGSFRRGVRSMRIVSESGVAGMVRMYQGHEIPPCVIMEFIRGQDLDGLRKIASFDPYEMGIPIMSRVAEIVHAAHVLPQTVFHRDLRPSNIMVRSDKTIPTLEDRVVVLDFDLSWHMGATDYEISPNMTTVLGYLAPEQLSREPIYSTQTAAVDVFGLAMTLYYVLLNKHPEPNASRAKEWDLILKTLLIQRPPLQWKSLPARVYRLIRAGTRKSPLERMQFPEMVTELRNLNRMIKGEKIEPLEYWLDELSSRSFGCGAYDWDGSNLAVTMSCVTGVSVEVRATGGPGEEIALTIRRIDRGDVRRSYVTKRWPERARAIREILESCGWSFQTGYQIARSGELNVEGSVSLNWLQSNIDQLASGIERAVHKISI